MNRKEAVILFLIDRGYSEEEAEEKLEEVLTFCGTSAEYAEEFICNIMEVPELLKRYIDFDEIASDMESNGEIEWIDFGLVVINPQDF